MKTKPENKTHCSHGGSIPLTRYARRTGRGVEGNVEKPRHYWHPFYLGRTRSSHETTTALSIIRRVKWALSPPKLALPFFFAIAFSFVYLAQGAKPARKKTPRSQYDRAVNVTLDTVMWVHEQHRGKMTWAQLNAEVCRAMKVRRTEPWQR